MFIFSTYFYTFRIRRRNNRSSNETASKPSRTLFLPRLCYSDSRARAFPSSISIFSPLSLSFLSALPHPSRFLSLCQPTPPHPAPTSSPSHRLHVSLRFSLMFFPHFILSLKPLLSTLSSLCRSRLTIAPRVAMGRAARGPWKTLLGTRGCRTRNEFSLPCHVRTV